MIIVLTQFWFLQWRKTCPAGTKTPSRSPSPSTSTWSWWSRLVIVYFGSQRKQHGDRDDEDQDQDSYQYFQLSKDQHSVTAFSPLSWSQRGDYEDFNNYIKDKYWRHKDMENIDICIVHLQISGICSEIANFSCVNGWNAPKYSLFSSQKEAFKIVNSNFSICFSLSRHSSRLWK